MFIEPWLKADFALIKCETADPVGNLTYNKTARNFSPLMCMAAKTTIVQTRNWWRGAISIPSTSLHPAFS